MNTVRIISFACVDCGTIHTAGESCVAVMFEVPENDMSCRHVAGLAQDCVYRQLRNAYGEAGIYAAESSCLTDQDYKEGFDHCAERIAPALEEELMAQEENE